MASNDNLMTIADQDRGPAVQGDDWRISVGVGESSTALCVTDAYGEAMVVMTNEQRARLADVLTRGEFAALAEVARVVLDESSWWMHPEMIEAIHRLQDARGDALPEGLPVLEGGDGES